MDDPEVVRKRSLSGFGPREWVLLAAGLLAIGLLVGVAVRDAAGSAVSIPQEAAAELEGGAKTVAVPAANEWYFRRVARLTQAFGREDADDWTRADGELAGSRDVNGEVVVTEEGVADPGLVAGLFASPIRAYEFYADLPDDPKATLDLVYQHVERAPVVFDAPGFACGAAKAPCEAAQQEAWSRQGAAFLAIKGMLHATTPPDEVQAKLLRAIAEIPRVEDVGTVTDIMGNDVLAVTWVPPFEHRASDDVVFTEEMQLLIDLDTSRYAGYQNIIARAGPVGEIRDSEVIISSGFVGDAGQTP